jgi:hypothetical protein
LEKNAAPSFFEVYGLAGRQCLKVWPLFLMKFLFMILQYVTFFLCLALLFGPFIARNMGHLMEGLKDPKNYDWSSVAGDWVGMLSDGSWWFILVAVILLYATWWGLLAALEDGGVYGTFWDLAQEGRLFSFGRFFERGFKLLLPMLWLQLYLGLWVLLVVGIWGLIAMIAVGFLALFGFPFGLGIALGILLGGPCLLFWILFGLGFGVFSYLCKAYVSQGMTAGESVRTSFKKFRAQGWRVGLGMLVALILYIAITISIRMVFMILGMIPILGILFQILDMFIAMTLALFIMIFLSGLSVTYLQDEETA